MALTSTVMATLQEYLGITLLGLIIGSFLGVLAIRLPERHPIAIARSTCDTCRHRLSARDLVPLLSWLMLRGRCRYCRAPIDLLHPTIELSALVVGLWAAAVTTGWMLMAGCVCGWLLLALAVTDWRRQVLPDVLTATLALAGLVFTWTFARPAFADHVVGAAVGFFAFLGIAWAYRQWRGRDGLGTGDGKLLGAIGAWVSWEGLPSVVLLAAGLALLVVFIRVAGGARVPGSERIALGTFLAAAAWLVWLYGPLNLG